MKKINIILCLGFFLFALSPQVFAQQNQKAGKQEVAQNKVVDDQLPAGFPKYVETGNSAVDAENYEKAKIAWYKANKPEVLSTGYLDIPGFTPTGNAEADARNYAKAKKQWITENPEAYKKLNTPQSMQVISRADYNNMPAVEKQRIDSRPNQFKIEK